MKSVLKRLRGILFALMYVALYYGVSWLVYNIYYIWNLTGGELTPTQIEKSATDGAYALAVIASIICLWLYMFIGRLRKEPLTENIGKRYVPPVIYIMAASLAVGCRLLVSVYYSFSQKIDILQKSIEKAALASPDIGSTSQMLIALFSVIIVAPLFEELLFRGLVMGQLMKIMRPWAAIALQAIVFGVAHGVLFQSIFACGIGIILGIVYYRTQSINTAVICHSVFNFSTILMQDNLSIKGAAVFLTAGLILISLSLFYIIDNSKSR